LKEKEFLKPIVKKPEHDVLNPKFRFKESTLPLKSLFESSDGERGTLNCFSRLKKYLTFKQFSPALFLLPIAVYVFIPSSKAGLASLTDWGDQSTYVSAYEEWRSTGKSGWLDNNWIGPGFIALMRLLSLPFGSIQTSLLMASFFGILISLVILIKQKAFSEGKLITITFIVLFVFLTHLQVFKDIPWTHLWVLPILLSAILIIYGGQSTRLKTFSGGFMLMFAWQIRNFETLAVIVAILIASLVSTIFEIANNTYRFRSDLNRKAIYLSGAITGFFFVSVLSGHAYIYRQYHASGVFSEMPPSIDLNPIHGFNRFIQLFLNPTFGSLTGYSAGPELGLIEQIVVRGSGLSAYWGQSLIRQQPMLLPLILISIVITLFSFFNLLKKGRESKEFKLVFTLGIAGLIVIAGYLSQPIIGTGHLKYGIAREFLLPQFLFVLQILVVFVTNIRLYRRVLLIVFFTSITLPLNLDFPDMSLKDFRFSLSAECIGDSMCSTKIEVIKKSGETKTLRSQSIYIRDSCGEKTTFYYGNSDGFPIRGCLSEHYISILPTSFGLAGTPDGQRVLESKETKLKV
jgi:hypothetical protein